MDEPSMLAQKPSSSHLQSTSHILRSTFHDLFTQDSIDADTIRHLSASRRGNNDYHDKYVERLLQVHNKWCASVDRSHKLVEYFNKARNDARDLEARENEEKVKEFESYTNLGLPPVVSKLKVFIDDSLVKQYNLVSPNEILNDDRQINVGISENEFIRQYESSTYSSRQLFEKILPEDCYMPKSPDLLPPKSNATDKKSRKNGLKQYPKSGNNGNDRNIWRNCINPLQRDIEKKDIANLQNKADFLKNPRFVDVPKSFLNKLSTGICDLGSYTEYFKPSPCPVVFTDYEVDKSYQARLELKNITSSCRQVRILQPTTKHFSVSQGEFPTDDALVAPGMSCNYIVTFTPDTLGNYDDVLTVKTQAREPMLIQLQARREPPLLSLPKHLDCGFSLVGDMKTVEYVVKNDGGNGRFCFVLEDEDKVISWNQIDSSGTIECLPFTLTPSAMKLDCGESINLQLTFAPFAVRVFSAKVTLYCDNCTQSEYFIEGKGEMPHVQLSYVEDGVLQPCLGEIFDETAQQIIQFGKQYPDVVCEKELHITNTVSVPLKFQWNILLPSVSPNVEDSNEVEDSVFTIQPTCGYLSGNAVKKFQVAFTPNKIGSFYDVASLVLLNIPLRQSDDSYILEDEVAMKLSLKGCTQEYSMTVSPAAVIMSGNYFVGKFYYRTVKLHNHSKECTSFKWNEINEDRCVINVSPSDGVVNADEEVECLLTVQGKNVGHVEYLIEYGIPFSTVKHVLHFECQFQGPNITFLESSLSFGLVRFGTVENRCVTIVNTSPIYATWIIMDDNELNRDKSPYSLYPCQGVIDAESTQKIAVNFCPSICKTVSNLFKCVVEFGNPCYLPVHAEVLRPRVYSEKCKIVVEEAFLDVPVERHITLVNANLLTTVFNWNLESDNADVSISCEPQTGVLKAHAKADICIQFSFHTLGDVEYFVVCDIEEMSEPVILSVQAKVNGLNVDVTMPNMDDIKNEKEIIRNNDILEFGVNNLIGQAVDVFVIMENKSAIQTNFAVSAKEFKPSRVPTPPKTEGNRATRGSSSRPVISKTLSASRSHKSEDQERKDYTCSILHDGKGVAFVCSPSTGLLSPLETKIVTITAYSDMWGEYEDTLICKVGDVDEKLIPIHIDVIGCPLNFQICKERTAIVRFGSHVSGDKAVIRNLRINNTSHFEIRLDWKTFVISPNDDKMIDLNLYYGDPFPSYDGDGNEIVDTCNFDERLIKVVLEEHYGIEANEPFSILNTQVVIPGKSDRIIDVCFRPPFGVLEETKYLGYALGYMSLSQKDCIKKGMYSRLHGLDMVPFSLNMTGSVKPARLHLEACDDDGFQFSLSASDLLDEGMLRESICCDRRFVLSNRCDTSMAFVCDVEPPFQIIHVCEGKKLHNNLVLKPQQNIQVTVRFAINLDLAASIYEENNQQVHRKFAIVFASSEMQVYHLLGTINYPSITVDEQIIDFGVCFVGVSKERGLTISNPSKVTLRWNIEIDSGCPTASASVFSFSLSNGVLDGNVAGSAGSDVKLYFSPKHNVDYECVVLVSSIFRRLCLKEEPMKVILRGKGSYDEAYHGRSDIL